MKTKKINRCPKCGSEDLSYEIDIFAKKPKDYYNGNVQCGKCQEQFKRKKVVEKKWLTVDETNELIDEKIKEAKEYCDELDKDKNLTYRAMVMREIKTTLENLKEELNTAPTDKQLSDAAKLKHLNRLPTIFGKKLNTPKHRIKK